MRTSAEDQVNNAAALAKQEKALKAAVLAYIKTPTKENKGWVYAEMFRYETIYELCELP